MPAQRRASLRVDGLQIDQAQRPDFVGPRELSRRDRDENLPPHPSAGSAALEFLDEIARQRRTVGHESLEQRERDARKCGPGHVRLSFS
jgi:hypothetical protein